MSPSAHPGSSTEVDSEDVSRKCHLLNLTPSIQWLEPQRLSFQDWAPGSPGWTESPGIS